MRILPILAILIAVALPGPRPAVAADDVAPSGKVVESFHGVLLEMMKNAESLGVEGRYKTATPAVGDAFHLNIMLRQAIGSRVWKDTPKDQRAALVSAFQNWTASTYASRFKGFSGQSFTTKSVKPGPRKGSAIVETELSNPGKKSVQLTYVMLKFQDRWGIYDVQTTRGVTISELAQRTSEYRKVLRDGGVPLLISSLNERAAKIRAQ